jgi:hypothetical protein
MLKAWLAIGLLATAAIAIPEALERRPVCETYQLGPRMGKEWWQWRWAESLPVWPRKTFRITNAGPDDIGITKDFELMALAPPGSTFEFRSAANTNYAFSLIQKVDLADVTFCEN